MKVAILGSGWGVRIQLPAFKEAGIEVASIWTNSGNKIEKLKQETGVSLVSTDWKSVIDAPGVTIVSVVSPPKLMLEQVIYAIDSKKHVICDKPVGLNAEETRKMVEQSDKLNNANAPGPNGTVPFVHFVDYELRFLSIIQEARNRIASGQIGTLERCEAVYTNDISEYPDWFYCEENGGGMLVCVGCHLLDATLFISQSKIKSVSSVFTIMRKQRKTKNSPKQMDQDITVEDQVTSLYQMDNGVRGILRIETSPDTSSTKYLTFCGSKGVIRVDLSTMELKQFDQYMNNVFTLKESLDTNTSCLKKVFPYGTLLLARKLAKHLNDRKVPFEGATLVDALHVRQVMDLMKQSSDQNSCWTQVEQ